MNIFKPAEIMQFAVRIEENGEKFYKQAAQATKDEEAKYMFTTWLSRRRNTKRSSRASWPRRMS